MLCTIKQRVIDDMRKSLSCFVTLHEEVLTRHFRAVEDAELDALPDEYTISDDALLREVHAHAIRDNICTLGFI